MFCSTPNNFFPVFCVFKKTKMFLFQGMAQYYAHAFDYYNPFCYIEVSGSSCYKLHNMALDKAFGLGWVSDFFCTSADASCCFCFHGSPRQKSCLYSSAWFVTSWGCLRTQLWQSGSLRPRGGRTISVNNTLLPKVTRPQHTSALDLSKRKSCYELWACRTTSLSDTTPQKPQVIWMGRGRIFHFNI